MRKQIQGSKWREAILLVAAMAFAATPVWPQASVHGTGTAGKIPVWTNGTTIGNSVLTQSGGNLTTSGGITAGSLTASGGITAGSLTASGGITGASLTGTSLICPLCVGNAQLSVNWALGSTKGGNAANADALGTHPLTDFPLLGSMNTFTMDQTINTNLILGGSINKALTLYGNVIDGAGDESSNVIGGFISGDGGHVPNSVVGGLTGATIAGGGGFENGVGDEPNSATDNWTTVGGGSANTAGGRWATVAGGSNNTASGFFGSVGGGSRNTAGPGVSSTVGGGASNTASGGHATVPGGLQNAAKGEGSFAAGEQATANNDGSFVWADGSAPVADSGAKQFVALASGGFTLYTKYDLSVGAILPSGSGTWGSFSDRNAKANFAPVDGPSLLEKVAALPILTWNYKAQDPSIRHMGPMAQDFRAAFGLGEDEKHIGTVDADGVSLAAIQALYKMVLEKDKQIDELRARLDRLEQKR